MKELTVEEKAKAYDEAIKKFDVILNLNTVKESGTIFADDVRKIFPELKESEDERIGKAIKLMYSFLPNEPAYIGDVPVEDIFSWLEKQGNLMKALQISNARIGELIEENYYLKEQLEKQGEWKPVWSEKDESNLDTAIYYIRREPYYENDVEPIVDWLRLLKERVQPKQEWKQENIGDLTDFENTMMHIGESFFGKNAGLDPNDTNAIKEQANILLGLVPSKEWGEEDEMFVHGLIRGLAAKRDIHGHTTFSSDCIDITKTINWLKSLKNRVQPEQKWSEEDKHTLQGIIGEIEANKYYAPDCDIATYDWFLSWLKSLKERVRLQPNQKWRPLGKHLEALAMAINDESLAISVRNDLNELLEQLKQL